MSYGEDDDAWDLIYEQTRKSLAEDPVQSHLGTVGDAIEARVKQCLKEAEDLRKATFYGPALTSAVTAIELMIRFLLLRPLVSGAFLSSEWESILADRIGEGLTTRDRELIRAVLRQWDLDITVVKLANGKPLWQSLVDRKVGVFEKRNRVVHQGARVEDSDVEIALECARVMLADVVFSIAQSFGFTLEKTGTWSRIRRDREGGGWSEAHFNPWDPIEGKAYDLPSTRK